MGCFCVLRIKDEGQKEDVNVLCSEFAQKICLYCKNNMNLDA